MLPPPRTARSGGARRGDLGAGTCLDGRGTQHRCTPLSTGLGWHLRVGAEGDRAVLKGQRLRVSSRLR
eukprot:11256305-Alexandrium_andersonii.AAC.1